MRIPTIPRMISFASNYVTLAGQEPSAIDMMKYNQEEVEAAALPALPSEDCRLVGVDSLGSKVVVCEDATPVVLTCIVGGVMYILTAFTSTRRDSWRVLGLALFLTIWVAGCTGELLAIHCYFGAAAFIVCVWTGFEVVMLYLHIAGYRSLPNTNADAGDN